MSNPAKPYRVHRELVKAGWIFNTYEYIIMYEDCRVYSSAYEGVAEDTCEAMNTAWRVGYFDGYGRGIWDGQNTKTSSTNVPAYRGNAGSLAY